MKNKFLLLFLFSLISAGLVAQTAVWNPAANDPSDGLWTTAANWTTGAVPTDNKTVFNVADAMDCTLDAAATCGQFMMGDNGPGGTLIIANGGSLSTGVAWSGIGHNNTAEIIIEAGGSLTLGEHAWIGHVAGGVGVIDVSGTFTVSAMTGLGWNGGQGLVTVHTGGVMNCLQFGGASIKGESVLDIRGGTVNLTGDKQGNVNDFIASGHIVAYGGGGTVTVELVDGNTIVTSEADVTAPTVLSTSPANAATGVPPVTNIQIEFSEPMNKSSVEGAITIAPTVANLAYAWNGNTVTITGDDMATLTAYTVTVGTGALDGNDIALEAEYSFGFETADPNAPPAIVTSVPADAAADVDADADIVLNFSKAMNTALTEAAISVAPALENSAFTWSNGDKTVTIASDRLLWESAYVITVAATAEDAGGIAMAAEATISFTVMAQPRTTIVWAAATDGSSDGLYTTAANWNLGEVADGNYKVVFNGGGAVPASHLNSEVTIAQLVMGDGGPGGDSLVVEDGGILNTFDGWSGIGYNQDATMVIEAGGEVNFASHAWIPLNAGAAKVEIYGTFNVGEMTGLGWAGGTGHVNIYEGGVMNCTQFADASIKDGSVLNIEGGTLVITGTVSALIQTYADAGKITAYGGAGLLRILQADGKTTITAGMTANTDAALSGITVNDGEIALDPAFDAATLSYTAVAPSGSTYVSVKATTNDPFATKAGDGVVDLSTGSGTATIVCTAEDGTTTQTYTVDVRVISSDATLSSITVDAGELDPAFDAATTSYTVLAPNGTTTVNVLGVPADANATVAGDGAIDVSSGSGTATIVVTAEDESTQTYTVEITVDPTSVESLTGNAVKAYYINNYDVVRIENADAVEYLQVIDITGKVQLNSVISKSETIEVGAGNLESGLYIIRMTLSDSSVQTSKFVK